MVGFPWIALAMGASSLVDAMLSNKSYPPELEALLKSLSVKGNELMNSPGLTTEEVEALFGKNYENVRQQGKNVRESTTSTLANMGMSKTGTAVKAARQNAWENENLVTNAIRDTVLAKKQAKQQDLSLATQMAGTATGAEVSRIDKGPDLTSIVGLLGLMGIGTGEGGPGKVGAAIDQVKPVADSYALLSGGAKSSTPLEVISDPIQEIIRSQNPFSSLYDNFNNFSLANPYKSRYSFGLW